VRAPSLLRPTVDFESPRPKSTMAKNLFSVSIFFIVFRESLEAVIIVSVLLGLVEQLVKTGGTSSHNPSTLVGIHEKDVTKDGSETPKSEGDVPVLENEVSETESDEANNQRLIRKMRLQASHLPLPLSTSVNLPLDLRRCWPRSLLCPRHWCRLHRCVLHSGVQSLDEERSVMGRHLQPGSLAPYPCHGPRRSSHRPCEGQMARQDSSVF
jgi:hypothetical protein